MSRSRSKQPVKKPHETTLEAATQGPAMALVDATDDRMVCVFREQDFEEWGRLLLAAPEMARALVSMLDAMTPTALADFDEEVSAMRAALTKAGVPIP